MSSVDADLSYLYGQLPKKIRAAAAAVKEKADRKVLTDISVATINAVGTAFRSVENLKKLLFKKRSD